MNQIYSLVKLFGERYIFCDDDQAAWDAMAINREELQAAYTAIMDYVKMKGIEIKRH